MGKQKPNLFKGVQGTPGRASETSLAPELSQSPPHPCTPNQKAGVVVVNRKACKRSGHGKVLQVAGLTEWEWGQSKPESLRGDPTTQGVSEPKSLGPRGPPAPPTTSCCTHDRPGLPWEVLTWPSAFLCSEGRQFTVRGIQGWAQKFQPPCKPRAETRGSKAEKNWAVSALILPPGW